MNSLLAAEGAHLLLQTRAKTINHELAAKFREWYPDFEIDETHDVAEGACAPGFSCSPSVPVAPSPRNRA